VKTESREVSLALLSQSDFDTPDISFTMISNQITFLLDWDWNVLIAPECYDKRVIDRFDPASRVVREVEFTQFTVAGSELRTECWAEEQSEK
jgi:hypothetical protein